MQIRQRLKLCLFAVCSVAAIQQLAAQPGQQAVEGASARGNTRVMMTSGDASLGQVRMVIGAGNQPGAQQQFMQASKTGDTEQISFSFTEVSLVFALRPLAGQLINAPLNLQRARQFELQENTDPDQAQPELAMVIVRQQPSPVDTSVQDAGIASGSAARTTGGLNVGVGNAMPFQDMVVIEDDLASERMVTVSGENLTMQEAITAIAEASRCNIFQDGQTIVVDYCEP